MARQTARRLAHNVADAAALLDISESAIRRLIADGYLATVPHLGRTVRIAHVELARFAAAKTAAPIVRAVA